jgi:osmotically-inducible protein OsmY
MDNLVPKEETKMTKTIGSIVAVFSLIFMLGGCRAITGETLGEHIDDSTITTSVKTKLAADKGSSLTRIQVDTDRGVVQLSGVVDSAAEKARAEQIARGVGGVKSVRNNLQTR